MINGKKLVVVLPAYNASATLASTYNQIPFDMVDEVVLVDDASSDETLSVAKSLGIKHIIPHEKNMGYGANQKTCYKTALELDADIVIMLHPDYQYTPKLIPAMAWPIANGLYHVVIGSRILGKGALKGGMPLYKYIANRFLTMVQNLLLNAKLSEYHTGYRAFSREALQQLKLDDNSNGFVFDNEMLAQLIYKDYEVAEITCPSRYFKEASSIGFIQSMTYGLGVLRVSILFRVHRWGIWKSKLFM